jgi:hypothetical protein
MNDVSVYFGGRQFMARQCRLAGDHPNQAPDDGCAHASAIALCALRETVDLSEVKKVRFSIMAGGEKAHQQRRERPWCNMQFIAKDL